MANPGILFEPPIEWITRQDSSLPSYVFTEVLRRTDADVRPGDDELFPGVTAFRAKTRLWFNGAAVFRPKTRELWFNELYHIRALREEYKFPTQVFQLLGLILCQALAVPRDCARKLLYGQTHNLLFFTNRRTIQVHCCHNDSERNILDVLLRIHDAFYFDREDAIFEGQTYDQVTERVFRESRPYLAWECIFPEGFDMEALSPRDLNAHIRAKQPAQQKAKPPPAKLTQKEERPPSTTSCGSS